MNDSLNFLLTNRIPRHLATLWFGWFSRIEQPIVRDVSLALWSRFADLNLAEARKTHFTSLHDCFTRELRPGVRPVDARPDILVSPCDGIVGAFGALAGTTAFQAKGFPYTLEELLHDPALVERYRDGRFVTLRLTSSMYHRFHAPADCRVTEAIYISGDTWNVNPPALQRVERLYCRNERVVIDAQLDAGSAVTLVAVAAVLVASVRLAWLGAPLDLRYTGAHRIPCGLAFRKGDELGYFEHGSTVIVFAPDGFEVCEHVEAGATVRMGQPLLRRG